MQEQDLHRSILTDPSMLLRIGPPRSGALDVHDAGELREKLARRRQVGRRGSRSSDASHRLRVGAGQARHHGGIRGETDDVARRQRAVELGDGEVLVHDPPSLEEDHSHELLTLDAEQQGHGTDPVGKLAREAAEHLRVPVADVVVHGDPAAPGRRDDRAARAARQPWHELPHCLLDGAQVVRLEMDRSERGGLLRAEPLLEPGHRAGHDDDVVLESPARVQGARDVIRRDHLEVEVLDLELPERRQHLAHELRPDSASPRLVARRRDP